MKKCCILAVLLISLTLAYGENSINILLRSNVPETFIITTSITATTSVDVFNSSETILGYINVLSTQSEDWTITVSSTNAGRMKGDTAGNTDTYPYTLKFGATSNISLATPFSVRIPGKTTNEAAYSLAVEFQNFWNSPTPVSSDTYKDTITVTIAAA
ncbi:MAG: hypothetical protein NT061_03105 [Spirochaetes bacterium]|nr:hypothetical protein [Spirochaetota bacterium]